jgi:hypothetical protein
LKGGTVPTKTLFQTLQFGTETIVIEVVQPGEDTHRMDMLPPDKAREQLPQDPWGDEPVVWGPDGRAFYSPTRQLNQYRRNGR